MPVETQRRGVVTQLTASCLQNRLGELLHCLASVHVHAGNEDRLDVQVRGVTLHGERLCVLASCWLQWLWR